MDAPVTLNVSDIRVGKRLRPVELKRVRALGDSIAANGLKTPISVALVERIEDGRPIKVHQLVAGLHRLEAVKSLGLVDVSAFVLDDDDDMLKLWEIDENLVRAELTDTQRATHHAERKRIMEAKGLVRRQGGDRKSNRQIADLKSYADEAADSLGVHPDTVRRDVRRGETIAPEVLAAVEGTDIDKGTVLDALAKLTTPDEQMKKAQEIAQVQELSRRKRQRKEKTAAEEFIVKHDDAEAAADIILSYVPDEEYDRLVSKLAGTTIKDLLRALKRGEQDRQAA